MSSRTNCKVKIKLKKNKHPIRTDDNENRANSFVLNNLRKLFG